MTIWKSIEKYEGLYDVSDEGDVRRLKSTAIEHRKIDAEDVETILLRAKTEPQRRIARDFGVSQGAISKIVRGLTFQPFSPHLLKPLLDRKGYPFVVLSKKGKTWQVPIHRLVAKAFLGDPAGLQVNHKDGNPRNNCLKNLEYVTASGNQLHRVDVLRKTQKLDLEKATAIRASKGNIAKADLAAQYGVSASMIEAIWYNRCWVRQ